MRRKIYTKEQILRAAYEVVATEGFAGFTARNIAKRMGISTQPIYLEFKNMEDLKNELLDLIFSKLKNEIFPVPHTGDKVIDLGLNYINFAKQHHNLYLALYVDEEGGGKKMHDFSFNYFSTLIENDPQYEGLSREQIQTLHTGTWVVVTGLASLASSGSINPTQEQIISLIQRTINNIIAVNETVN
ncbi:TetR family transcriptional regulator [Enterococcus phoeniculicola]|jgi:AcrR family transcriptional regulator|uniref:TetR family transcriptional regulator n=1 Tax=Enterococcus phoeniculicola ATCC BAA-412 TaxID=1158610 RepID=R3WJ11_9ENTE|nr:TetR/AcrR family transcriptional regulator [Enterococcus phoeniculicola]EOL41870.1 TetR family transcriptional regulator [Enterococcus phoeniculicola ATCC BAA-412]EOT79851.1 TetR family transcriptional regulator [Enterococcus phoeniculicola ATCC BAA-412]OJG70261.1 TetR family transcriptional regulator [Enterococcus phoeniculicola]